MRVLAKRRKNVFCVFYLLLLPFACLVIWQSIRFLSLLGVLMGFGFMWLALTGFGKEMFNSKNVILAKDATGELYFSHERKTFKANEIVSVCSISKSGFLGIKIIKTGELEIMTKDKKYTYTDIVNVDKAADEIRNFLYVQDNKM